MAPPPKAKLKFGEPEKRNMTTTILTWGFVVVVVGAIIWMIAANPKQKNLTCSTGGQTSLIGFGSCSEE